MDHEDSAAAQDRLNVEARAHAHRLRERAPADADRYDSREEVDR